MGKPFQPAVDDQTRAAIVAEYLAGGTGPAIATRYGIGTQSVLRYVRAAGHVTRPRGHAPKVLFAVLADDYAECRNADAVAARHGVDRTVVRRAVLALGQHYNTRRESQVKYPFNERAFAVITDESAYWLGYLLADGCVLSRKTGGSRNCLQVAVARIDRPHLQQLLDFLGSAAPIRDYEPCDQFGNAHPASSIRINSELLVRDLIRWGITPRKSLTADPHPALCEMPAFWRGMVDGDGCVRWANRDGRHWGQPRPVMELIGSLAVCSKFAAFVKRHIPESERTPRQAKGRVIWSVRWFGPQAKQLAALLYTEPCLALPRKREIATAFAGYTPKQTKKPRPTATPPV